MKTKVELGAQVVEFVRSLPPEPRKMLRAAIHGLETEEGDIKQLEGELAAYLRLRAGRYRVIFRSYVQGGKKVTRCVFSERRAVVYELFSEILRDPEYLQ
jgi:mRNA-degrading endonuclease RelE of RelBE toxin-antitoxin system